DPACLFAFWVEYTVTFGRYAGGGRISECFGGLIGRKQSIFLRFLLSQGLALKIFGHKGQEA
ncbi:MAG: hypothetical protein J6L74_00435, partial [Pseudomonas sp.]|nr:hypothetical protein [Pseudomonas sp.]